MTLQGFKDKYLGKQVEYHSYGGANTHYQCVDLVNQYIKEVLGLTPIIGTNAKDFRGNDEFEWIPNTPTGVPEPGDIVVWNGRVGGGAGHIAVFISGNANSFTSLDQNWSQKQRVTIENHNYNSVSGWLRPKGNMSDMYKGLDLNNKDSMKVAVDIWHQVIHEGLWVKKEEVDTQIAGYRSRITDLGRQLGTAQAEASNAIEKASRLQVEIDNGLEREKLLGTQLQNKQDELEAMAQSKGVLATELAQAKEKIATLEAEKGNGEYTLTIGELIKMILNQKITIRR